MELDAGGAHVPRFKLVWTESDRASIRGIFHKVMFFQVDPLLSFFFWGEEHLSRKSSTKVVGSEVNHYRFSCCEAFGIFRDLSFGRIHGGKGGFTNWDHVFLNLGRFLFLIFPLSEWFSGT